MRYAVEAPAELVVLECNCSMCRLVGYLHLIVERSQFELLSGAADLVSYRFNTGVAEHLFCRACGIKSFYVPRSHPDGYSVNARCLDAVPIGAMRIQPFDGAHWEQHVGEIRI